MIETSRMSGTSSSVVRPGANRAAAMSFRALFFAPVTRTRPRSCAPPVTSKQSTGSPYGGPSAGSHRELASGGGQQGPTASWRVVGGSRVPPRAGEWWGAAGSHRELASGGGQQGPTASWASGGGHHGPSSRLGAMTIRLTRIYTRTGDAGQT